MTSLSRGQQLFCPARLISSFRDHSRRSSKIWPWVASQEPRAVPEGGIPLPPLLAFHRGTGKVPRVTHHGPFSRANVSNPVLGLSGFPGLEVVHQWIGIPIFSAYLVAALGNCTILYVIWTEPSLHQPMYYFLAMLATTDLGLCLTTVPTVMGVLWFQLRKISKHACIAQLFIVHSFSFMESAVLFAMAIDRFLAICFPLRYAALVTPTRVATMGLVLLLRSTVFLLPPVPFMLRFPYCPEAVLSHSYCLHQDLIRLACANTAFNSLYALTLILLTMGSDLLFILLSYSLILKAVLGMTSGDEGHRKALGTCVSHVCAVLVFYVPVLGLSVVHRFGQHASPLLHVIMGNIYILLPPLMNPVIYSIKTKQIYSRILRITSVLNPLGRKGC